MAAPPYKLDSKAVQVVAQRNASADEFDVTIVCDDGSVRHAWYRKGVGWVGIETIAKP